MTNIKEKIGIIAADIATLNNKNIILINMINQIEKNINY